MQFEYSKHWLKKMKYRPDISDDMFEYCIQNSNKLKDKYQEDAFNAISRIPPSGRLLKVVYKIKGKIIKILTAYWLDQKMEKWYDDDEDILSIQLKQGEYWKSVELPNGVVFDISKDGSILAVEIIKASKIFSGDVRKVIENIKNS